MEIDKNVIKGRIGQHLLTALYEIDQAVSDIFILPDDAAGESQYQAEIAELYDAKVAVKKILNKHFDELAIARAIETDKF